MSVPPGFYAGSGTSADPYYGYYEGNPYTGKMLELDRADAIKYMSGEIDQYGNPIVDERPIVFDDYLDTGTPTSTGVDPNNPNPPPPTGAPPPAGPSFDDSDAALGVKDSWQMDYPGDTILEWMQNRGGMYPDNPYYSKIMGTQSGLQTLFDVFYNPAALGDETNAMFGNFVQDLFTAGGDYSWNLNTFRNVINDIMQGDVKGVLSEVLSTTENPSGAMEILNNLFRVFSPLMTPGAKRAFEVQLAKIWDDMSTAYRNGATAHQAFTEAVTGLGKSFFGL